jgi:hypothetical protein
MTEMIPKVKKVIVDYLVKDLMPVEIIYYKDSIWFIDREQRYWYFEYHKEDKHLWWRWSHFQSALKIFSLNGEEHQGIFGELVNMILNKKQNLETKYPDKVFKTVGSVMNFKEESKEVLNSKVNTTGVRYFNGEWRVEEALNCEVKKTLSGGAKKSMEAHKVLDQEVKTTVIPSERSFFRVDEVLNHEVKKIRECHSANTSEVEDVLNQEVNTTSVRYLSRFRRVEEILNHNVKTTGFEVLSLNETVKEVLTHNVETTGFVSGSRPLSTEEVLNHNVETIGEAYINDNYVTEEILNNTIDTYDSGELVDEEKLVNNVLNYGADTIEIKSIERMNGESPFQDIVVGHILDESEKVTDKLKIKEDDRVKSYSCDVFMCDFLVQNVLDIGSNSINFDVTSQQGRVDGVLKNS